MDGDLRTVTSHLMQKHLGGWMGTAILPRLFHFPGEGKRREVKARVAMTLGPGRGRGHQRGGILATTFLSMCQPPAAGMGSAAQGSRHEPTNLIARPFTPSGLPDAGAQFAAVSCAGPACFSLSPPSSLQAWVALCDFASVYGSKISLPPFCGPQT